MMDKAGFDRDALRIVLGMVRMKPTFDESVAIVKAELSRVYDLGVAAERERCEMIALTEPLVFDDHLVIAQMVCRIAQRIRAVTETEPPPLKQE